MLAHPGYKFRIESVLDIRFPLLAALAFESQSASVVTGTDTVNEWATKLIEQLVFEGRVLKEVRTDVGVHAAYQLPDNFADRKDKPLRSQRHTAGRCSHVFPTTDSKVNWLLLVVCV